MAKKSDERLLAISKLLADAEVQRKREVKELSEELRQREIDAAAFRQSILEEMHRQILSGEITLPKRREKQVHLIGCTYDLDQKEHKMPVLFASYDSGDARFGVHYRLAFVEFDPKAKR